jgi:hypothetical protein
MERSITFVLHSENHIFKAKNYLKNPYRVFPQTTLPKDRQLVFLLSSECVNKLYLYPIFLWAIEIIQNPGN